MPILSSSFSDEELVGLVMKLVSIPSYPGVPAQETAVAKYIKEVFESEGIEAELSYAEGDRCNVKAVLRGSGGGRSLLLTGHTDTVKPDGMERATEPYIEDGRIFGRGTSDMKGPLACMMATLIGIKRSGVQLRGDVIFAGAIDEEQRSYGTIDFIERGLRADGAIVGEPTGLDICLAHRGLEWYVFHFIGKAVHGGRQKEGINAISKAAKFIRVLEEELIPKLDARTHPLMGSATINVGVIEGGTQLSTVAGDCKVWVDRRFLPSESFADVNSELQEILDRLAAEDADFKCEMSIMEESVMREGFIHESMELAEDDALVLALDDASQQACGDTRPHTYFPAWTDAGLLDKYAHIPTAVFGPGEIKCCHAPDEYMPIEHLRKAYLSYALAAVKYCA